MIRASTRAAAGAAVVALVAGGCAGKRVAARRDEGTSIVVAHIDARRSPRTWKDVPVRCQDREGKYDWWKMRQDGDGLVYVENVPSGGSCWITGGFNGGIDVYVFKLPPEAAGNPTATRIPRPGAWFMGSFRYQPLGDDEFEFVRVATPSEREVMTRLLPQTEGTPWEALVRSRLQR